MCIRDSCDAHPSSSVDRGQCGDAPALSPTPTPPGTYHSADLAHDGTALRIITTDYDEKPQTDYLSGDEDPLTRVQSSVPPAKRFVRRLDPRGAPLLSLIHI